MRVFVRLVVVFEAYLKRRKASQQASFNIWNVAPHVNSSQEPPLWWLYVFVKQVCCCRMLCLPQCSEACWEGKGQFLEQR